jgi:hypothetical protein
VNLNDKKCEGCHLKAANIGLSNLAVFALATAGGDLAAGCMGE